MTKITWMMEYKAMYMVFEYLEDILVDRVPVGLQGTGIICS